MKSSPITLIVIGFILLSLMATNPSIEDHRQAVIEKMKEKVQQIDPTTGEKVNIENNWQKAGEAIGMAIGQGIVEKSVSRDNYLLFSLTKLTFGDNIKNIGVGILGNVKVYDDFKNNKEGFVENKTASNLIIENIEVYPNDLPGMYNWQDAKNRCLELGDGWRLPTIIELNILYKNKDKIGGFSSNFYWSSTEASEDRAANLDFSTGDQYDMTVKEMTRSIRAIRTF